MPFRLIIGFIVLATSLVAAEITTPAQQQPWQKIAPVGESFSVLMPCRAIESTPEHHALAVGTAEVASPIAPSQPISSSFETLRPHRAVGLTPSQMAADLKPDAEQAAVGNRTTLFTITIPPS